MKRYIARVGVGIKPSAIGDSQEATNGDESPGVGHVAPERLGRPPGITKRRAPVTIQTRTRGRPRKKHQQGPNLESEEADAESSNNSSPSSDYSDEEDGDSAEKKKNSRKFHQKPRQRIAAARTRERLPRRAKGDKV